jgi:5-(carboxyamino)imidazole ribonucleotide mutase
VATVAIDGGRIAGLLAAQILALSDPELSSRLGAPRAEMAEAARGADSRVREG